MSKRVELPIVDPVYGTYHHQGTSTAIAANNPTIRNWCLNEKMNLACSRKFLSGFTTPEIVIPWSSWWDCPFLQCYVVCSKFVKGYVNKVIREMLDQGYYISFSNIDDYYVEGKSWYREKHFYHDGVICGYDQENKMFCLYAYDSNWIYQKFWTPQRSFNKARIASEKQGLYSDFCALKVKEDNIEFSPKMVYERLKEYLDSNLEKYPFNGEGDVYGIVVHAFIAEYVAKLYRGDIPYERMDRRVFRVIWEHKKAMKERIELVEKNLGLNDTISKKYAELLKEADTMRMLYASHHMKRRDSVLPVIEKKLLTLMENERELLNQLLSEMERKFENESVELP